MQSIKRKILIGCVSILLTACSSLEKELRDQSIEKQIIPTVGSVPNRVELEQAWDNQTRMDFWFTSQGSKIIPYSWFAWLEMADSEELFRSVKHMDSLRYIPMPATKENPAGLPIGFALTRGAEGDEWMGLSCAACHTNQLNYQGNAILIEGAPTLANFVLFFDKLVAALNATHVDDSKFERFAKKVLADNYSEKAAGRLRSRLQAVALAAAERQQVNSLPPEYPADFTSYARLDAFGNIQNAGTAFALSDLSNSNPPTAPVSYPFLWGTHQSDVVQWNASAPNTPIVGPLIRNIGEVVGVFGELNIERAPWWRRLIGIKYHYSSSVNMIGLGELELWVKQLRSPAWPEEYLPAIDTEKAANGAVIYAQECAGCHQVISRAEEGDNYIAKKIPLTTVGTDPVMAWNANYHQAKSLILEGSKEEILIGDEFEATTAAINIPVNGVVGVVLKDLGTALRAGMIPLKDDERDLKTIKDAIKEYSKQQNGLTKPSETNGLNPGNTKDLNSLVYKARPLNGIWATAPFLHNGSVPNLWQLLQKPEKRRTSFWVGSREFDPVNVGYQMDNGLNEFKTLKSDGTVQPGNSNAGHEYGTRLSDNKKWALVEYLKTL